MSDRDIPAGAMWLKLIMEELKETRFGIVCITPENRDRSWLHFEAGAIAKAIDNDNYVCPYLISLGGSELIDNPLSNFQYKIANEQGTKELVQSINRAIEKPLEADVLEETFNIWWQKLYVELEGIPEPQTKREIRPSTQDMLVEVLEGIRRIEHSIAADVSARAMMNSLPQPKTLGELFGKVYKSDPAIVAYIERVREGSSLGVPQNPVQD
jgi:hypothetical protein